MTTRTAIDLPRSARAYTKPCSARAFQAGSLPCGAANAKSSATSCTAICSSTCPSITEKSARLLQIENVHDLLDLARPKVEAEAALTPGKHKVEFAFKYDGPGLGKGGTGIITVDGVEAGHGKFPHTVPFALEASETFDVGSDTGTGVNDADYETPFAFDGKLNSLTLKLLPPG